MSSSLRFNFVIIYVSFSEAMIRILCLLSLCAIAGSEEISRPLLLAELDLNVTKILLHLNEWRRDKLSSRTDPSESLSSTESLFFTTGSTAPSPHYSSESTTGINLPTEQTPAESTTESPSYQSSEPATTDSTTEDSTIEFDSTLIRDKSKCPTFETSPATSFSCADKPYIPGVYADVETGCQVFYVCWPHIKEKLACPVGTIFNQALAKCDFLYNSNCSQAEQFYGANAVIAESYPPGPYTELDYLGSLTLTLWDKMGYLRSQMLPQFDEPLTADEQRINEDIKLALGMLPCKHEFQNADTRTEPSAESRVGILKDVFESSRHDTNKYFLIIKKLIKKLIEHIEAKYPQSTNIMGTNEDQLLMALVLFLSELVHEIYDLLET